MASRIPGPFFANFRSDPVPPVWKGTFTYYAAGILTAGTTGVMGTDYVFRLNSCYDPDLTGSGRQPYGWDQVSALYQYYVVKRADLEITAFDPSEDGLAFVAMLGQSNNATALAGYTYEVAAERPMSVGMLVSATGSQKQTIKQSVNIADIDGLTRQQHEANLSQYGAAVGANPTFYPTLRVSVGSIRQATGGTISFEVRITFHAQLYQRVIQSSS